MSWTLAVWCWLLMGGTATSLTATAGSCEDSQEPVFCQSNIQVPSITVTVELPMDPPIASGDSPLVDPQCIVNVTRDDTTHILVPASVTGNITYTCVTTSSTLLWQIGGCDADELSYQLIDRDEFALNGVVVQDSTSGSSSLLLYMAGREFLSKQLQSDWFTVQCVAIVDDLNVFGGAVYTLELYDTPGAPTDLELLCQPTESPTSAVLQWTRPDYRTTSPEVALTYWVAVERLNDSSPVFDDTTSNTSTLIEVPSDMMNTPLRFTVVAMNECVNSSEPATLNDTIPPGTCTSRLQSASVAFYGSIVQLACYYTYAANEPVGNYTYYTCVFTFFLESGGEEEFEVLGNEDNPQYYQTNNTREAYVRIEVRYGDEVVQPSIVDRTITDIAVAKVEVAGSDLLLSCTLTPASVAVGCLFVVLSSANGILERFPVLVTDTGSHCVQDQASIPSQVYAMYDGGLIDYSTSYAVDIRAVRSLPQCGSPRPTITRPVVPSSEVVGPVCPTPTDPTVEVETSASRLSEGAVAGISVAIVLPLSLIVGALLGGLAVYCLCRKRTDKNVGTLTYEQQNMTTEDDYKETQQTTQNDDLIEETMEV